MKIGLSGKVEIGDGYRMDDEDGFSVRIGGVDVVAELTGYFPAQNKVTAALCDRAFSGDLDVEMGAPYSEVTPDEPDKLLVGGSNLLEMLKAAEGKEVALIISDEPVNMIEAMEELQSSQKRRDRKPEWVKISHDPAKKLALGKVGKKLRTSVRTAKRRKKKSVPTPW